jgi:hypothetical protein
VTDHRVFRTEWLHGRRSIHCTCGHRTAFLDDDLATEDHVQHRLKSLKAHAHS